MSMLIICKECNDLFILTSNHKVGSIVLISSYLIFILGYAYVIFVFDPLFLHLLGHYCWCIVFSKFHVLSS